jgi:XTP/dITP diphosphohydrolase
VADDTGLEVAALGGAPGVHTARYAGPGAGYAANRRALLAALEGVPDRRARFRTVVALVVPEAGEVVAEGVLEGWITREERGSGGFGYDPVFEVEGRTLAELGEDHKNRISHRARALAALAAALGEA